MSRRDCEQPDRAPRMADAVSARVNGVDPPAPVIRAQSISFVTIGDAALLIVASVTVMQRPPVDERPRKIPSVTIPCAVELAASAVSVARFLDAPNGKS